MRMVGTIFDTTHILSDESKILKQIFKLKKLVPFLLNFHISAVSKL